LGFYGGDLVLWFYAVIFLALNDGFGGICFFAQEGLGRKSENCFTTPYKGEEV
jgi:hypothetical protein